MEDQKFEAGERVAIKTANSWTRNRYILGTVKRITPKGQVVVTSDYNPIGLIRFQKKYENYVEQGKYYYRGDILVKLTPQIRREIALYNARANVNYFFDYNKKREKLTLEEYQAILEVIAPYRRER